MSLDPYHPHLGEGDITPDLMRIMDDVIPEMMSRMETDLTPTDMMAITACIIKMITRTAKLVGASVGVPVLSASDMLGESEYDFFEESQQRGEI